MYSPQELSRYFQRINYQGPMDLNQTTLDDIARHHALSIPFENFSVFLNGCVDLSIAGLFDKMVLQGRGGWCFEQNGLLGTVLGSLGFGVQNLMARNIMAPGKPRSHQVLIITIPGDTGRYLVDAGFGAQTLRGALPLAQGATAIHTGQPFYLEEQVPKPDATVPGAIGQWVLSTKSGPDWKPLYQFSLDTFYPADFEMANHFHVTSPNSSFTQARVLSLPQEGGRYSLVDRLFKRYQAGPGGETLLEEITCTSVDQLKHYLVEICKVKLSHHDVETLFDLGPAKRLTPSNIPKE